jgi:hypothetical protein
MAFNRERIKKLHVDRPESDAERDLLHRLALAFDAPIIDQISISVELTAWLEGRPEDDVLLPSLSTPVSNVLHLLSTSPFAGHGPHSRNTSISTSGNSGTSKSES